MLATIDSVEEQVNDEGYGTLRVKQHDRLAAPLAAKMLGMSNASRVLVQILDPAYR